MKRWNCRGVNSKCLYMNAGGTLSPSLSLCLPSNTFLGYSFDSLFKTAFTFEKVDR